MMDTRLLQSWLDLPPGPWPPPPEVLLALSPQASPAQAEQKALKLMSRLRPHQLIHPELVTEGMNRLAQAMLAYQQRARREPVAQTLAEPVQGPAQSSVSALAPSLAHNSMTVDLAPGRVAPLAEVSPPVQPSLDPRATVLELSPLNLDRQRDPQAPTVPTLPTVPSAAVLEVSVPVGPVVLDAEVVETFEQAYPRLRLRRWSETQQIDFLPEFLPARVPVLGQLPLWPDLLVWSDRRTGLRRRRYLAAIATRWFRWGGWVARPEESLGTALSLVNYEQLRGELESILQRWNNHDPRGYQGFLAVSQGLAGWILHPDSSRLLREAEPHQREKLAEAWAILAGAIPSWLDALQDQLRASRPRQGRFLSALRTSAVQLFPSLWLVVPILWILLIVLLRS